MATTVAELVAKLSADTSGFDKAMGKADGKSRKVASVMSKGFLAIGAAAVVGGAFAVKAASNLEEQINKTRVVFRGSEEQILSWSETTASGLGISQRAALEAAGTFGNMLVPMGLARGKAADMSREMVNLAADMASFNNASPEETLDALRAGLAGETEPLRRFGVFLSEARLKQEAVSLGLIKTAKQDLPAAAKAQATYSLILKDTTDAQGDFARTSDSVANSQRVLRAEVEDLAAQLGAALLPAMRTILDMGVSLVKTIGDNTREFGLAAAAVAVFGGAIVLANTSLAIYNSSLLMAVKATKLLRVAMAATPWLAAIAAVGFIAEHFLNQADSAKTAEDAQKDLTNALLEYNDAVKAGKNARLDLESANLRLERAEINVKQALNDRRQVDKDSTSTLLERREADLRVAEALNERRRAENDATEAANKGRDAQIGQNNAANALRGSFGKLTAQFQDNTTEQRKVYKAGRDVIGSLRNTAVNAGDAARNAHRYADALRNMAGKADTSNPKLARTARLAATLADAWLRVVSLPAAREFVARFRVITSIEENRLNTPSHPQRASGGPVSQGVSYVVGERGPEMFVPRQNGTIVPNGAAVGSTVYNFNGPVLNGEGLLRYIQQQSKTSGRRGGPSIQFGT